MTQLETHLTTKQLADRWGTHANTIQRWRTEGVGPKFIRLGHKRIRYPISEIEAYEAQTFRSTAEKPRDEYRPGVGREKNNPR